MKEIVANLQTVIKEIKGEDVNNMVEVLKKARRVFIYGTGRSGLVGKAFAMRLMHLGLEVYVIGETITPAIRRDDVLICISGSGETKSVILVCSSAKKVQAKIIAITSHKDSSLAKEADVVVVVKGRTKSEKKDYIQDQILGRHEPLTPLGTLFEDTCLVFLDGIIVELMHVLGKKEKDLRTAHFDIEIA